MSLPLSTGGGIYIPPRSLVGRRNVLIIGSILILNYTTIDKSNILIQNSSL